MVGVIGDVKHWGLDAPVNPELYVPTTQFPAFGVDLGAPHRTAIRSRSCRSRSATFARSMPNLPLFQVRTMEEVAARSVERRRWTMTLLAVFAVLALVLAAAGIYGVMAHLVSLRTPEIGVRLTLGAKPASVMRQILGEGAMQARSD